mmetsp:Transcript_5412/g.17371  ORF Transcript_5412/g.17371 Transcript_5412/m.17371 type:complete len:315 (+) Transcript_5412:78-1022(+)
MVVVRSDAGGAEVHQLLCGRELAADARGNLVHRFAAQMANYVYLVVDRAAGAALAVDPAWDVQGLLATCEELGVTLRAAAFTHRHFDHTGGIVPRSITGAAEDIRLPGVADLLEAGVACYVGKRDAETVASQAAIALDALRAVEEGSVVRLTDAVSLHVLETPGHTRGSVCFRLGSDAGDLLFTGDTLFIGSCGRVDLPESNVGDMVLSLARLAKLAEDTTVLPGHNYAMEAHSSIGGERTTNHMMMQAIERERSRAGIGAEPVAAQLPLPDYLGVARSIWRSHSDHHDHQGDLPDTACACPPLPPCRNLESHF